MACCFVLRKFCLDDPKSWSKFVGKAAASWKLYEKICTFSINGASEDVETLKKYRAHTSFTQRSIAHHL